MTATSDPRPVAPPLDVVRWFNTDAPLSLDGLRGKVIVVHAFQMLCPACVVHSIPQARRLHEIARALDDLVILGLHCVFEHHDVMTPAALEVFLHEYRVAFPVAIDRPSADGAIPCTMAAYGLRGTPSTLVVGRDGRLVHHGFGAEDDLVLGLMLGQALSG